MHRRPVPINLRIRDLDPRERLTMVCPSCRGEIGRQGYDLSLELPADYLVIRYVARHWCRRCSKGDAKVRAEGWIEDWPRSGAEGRDQSWGEYPWATPRLRTPS